MTLHRRMVLPGVVAILLVVLGCGGGSDVGNPNIAGTVTSRLTDGPKAAGARVVLSSRDAPGIGSLMDTVSIKGVTTIVTSLFFDTTYADQYGRFRFDEVPSGSYVLVASYNGLLALEYVEQRPNQDEEGVLLVVTDPATVYLNTYTDLDTSKPYFRAARIAGTGFIDSLNASGEIVLRDVPAGDLGLLCYRSDGHTVLFPVLHTDAGCQAELYSSPDLPVDYWTPHPCGPRDPLGRPYILETTVWTSGASPADVTFDEKVFDIRLSFSHAMDARSTKSAIHAFSDDSSASIKSLRWDGGNTLYIALCSADTAGECRSGEDRFLKGRTYGVTIDTTAQTALGVHFAHDAYVRFVPVP